MCLYFACSKTDDYDDYGQVCTPPTVSHIFKDGADCCVLAWGLQVRLGRFSNIPRVGLEFFPQVAAQLGKTERKEKASHQTTTKKRTH